MKLLIISVFSVLCATASVAGDRAAPTGQPDAAAPIEPAPTPGHSPLLPILLVTGAGLTAFGVFEISKSKGTLASDNGVNPDPEVSPEQSRRNYINSAVLIGTPIVVAGLIYGGPALWALAAPTVRAFWQRGEVSFERVATSEAGAINLSKARELRPGPTLNNLNVQLAAQEIAGGHAYAKHAAELGVKSSPELAARIESIIANPTMMRALTNGRTAYWHQASDTVVIRTPSALDGGTVFVAKAGEKYFLNLR